MKMKFFYSFLLLLVLVSCNDFSDLNAESEKNKQRNEAVFKAISKEWNFVFPSTKPEIHTALNEWKDWQQFQNELEQKPKTSLLAFQMKIENVSKRADSLYLTVPAKFNNPQVRSRLITLDTQLNSLNTYMHLQVIPEKKVITLINSVNGEIKSVYKQLEEIIIKEAIPMEIGEADLIKALDTSRMATEKVFDDNLKKMDSVNEKPKRKPFLKK
ncbi:hypothetical protein [Flavobacterium haoranii]|uniref:Uncharacterized protein n=1 Tax=Flavobacterium haoranii TaxID=683124 RepID=A0A1M6DJK0_9FLAO|nr:hypothetical protein [Flavobacterium haoranii]SHI73385.1 hypothetical protein SAMN05444337_0665 [Flavobacterium haoranii]